MIGIGANLPSASGAPLQTCVAALDALDDIGVVVARRSRWYRSAPVPASDQPWFVNGVAAVETVLDPADLLEVLHGVERRFGRERGAHWAARTLDLDLLDHGGRLRDGVPPPELPHPRMEERAFVLLPLADVAPDWRHPRHGRSVNEMIAALDPARTATPIS